MKDTARVLGRMFDGIEYRGSAHENVEILARYAGVPVWNGLTDQWHPTQMLADVLTMRDHSTRPLDELAYCYLGDARNNTANSLLVTGALLGMDVRIGRPRVAVAVGRGPRHRRAARGHLGRARHGRPTTPQGGVRTSTSSTPTSGCRWASRRRNGASGSTELLPYQVNAELVTATGNPKVKFLHCLPALHNRRHRGRRADLRKVGPLRARGDRRGLRVPGLDRVRPGREPPAHDQGGHGRHRRGLTCDWSIAVGGNALLERGRGAAGRDPGGARRRRGRGARPAGSMTTTW